MTNIVPSGPGLERLRGAPNISDKAARGGGFQGIGEHLASSFLDDFSPGIHDLVRPSLQPIASTLTRTLRDVAYSYVPAQGLPGSLHFDESLPSVDVPEGPLRAVLEHLVESALRGNPSLKPYCHVGVFEDSAERFVLSVRDNGAPLPECTMEDLRAFLQGTAARHVPDRVHRLFLADTLAQWLGGRIRIAPTPNAAGTTILLEIPRQRSRPARDPLVGRHVF